MPSVLTPAEEEFSLSAAIITSSPAPLLLMDDDLAIVAASKSFCHAHDIDEAKLKGRTLFQIGKEEWDIPQLRTLLVATLANDIGVAAYEMDLKWAGGETRRLVLNAKKLRYGDGTLTRLLLTINDVTEAKLKEKLKDDLVREKEVLLLEVQHRVANSLQIIASVLMQSARMVQSDETRSHLKDAHGRVMSIAAVQRHLALSGAKTVSLRPYFAQLCQSLEASMIRDHDQLTLEVDVDDTIVNANVSLSLGLIVTELVINSLKHAFLDDRKGKIIVRFKSDIADWHLTVADNGVGMPADSAKVEPGLGTGIVEALTKQLQASFAVSDAKPGTRVHIDGKADGVAVTKLNVGRPQQRMLS